MAIKNCNIVNANYDRVMEVMERLLRERYKNACGCERCMSDIAAIALNYLPPHYIVDRDKGHETASPWVMVETAVMEAIDRVRDNPKHGAAYLADTSGGPAENIVS